MRAFFLSLKPKKNGDFRIYFESLIIPSKNLYWKPTNFQNFILQKIHGNNRRLFWIFKNFIGRRKGFGLFP